MVYIIRFFCVFLHLAVNLGISLKWESIIKQSIILQENKFLSENEGKLVYISGMANTRDDVTDSEFLINRNAFKLYRKVEIYQNLSDDKYKLSWQQIVPQSKNKSNFSSQYFST